jgi:DNA polymerase delta subunit 1
MVQVRSFYIDNAPSIGDRIAYIMIAGTKGSKNYENAEDPNYVLEHDIPIDFNYYLEKQIKPPLLRIFELIIDNPSSLFVGDHTKIMYVPKLAN